MSIMWKLCTCVLLLSIQLVTVHSNGFGWGSGDNNGGGGGGNPGAQQPHNSAPDTSISSSPPRYQPSAGRATNENYWWLNSNPFQKPPNHPGVVRGDEQVPSNNSPRPSSNYGNQPAQPAQSPGAYGASQPPSYSQSNPAYGSSGKPQVEPVPQNQNQNQSPGSYNNIAKPQPQVQPASPQRPNPAPYGNAPPSAPGNGWGSPSSPPAGGPPPQNYQPPSITFDECQLKNKADCHPGGAPAINPGYNQVDSPSYSNQQVGPSPNAYPEVASASYTQPKPQVPAPAPQQQQPQPIEGPSYGSSPPKTPQVQPAPQSPGYGQQINQNPSAPQPVKTPGTDSTYQPSSGNPYTGSGSNASPVAPKPSYEPEKPSYNSVPTSNQYQSGPIPPAQSPPLPVQNTNNYAPGTPQKPSYGPESGNPVVNPYSPNKVQPQPPVNNNIVYQPNPVNTYNPSKTPQSPQYTGQNYQQPQPQQPAYAPNPNNNNNNNGEPQLPYPGCPAALLCVQDNLCNSEGVISDKPVALSPAELVYRVALMACSAPGTGAVGVCCRDPNYKDPWPNMNGNGNGGGQPQHHHHDGQQGGNNGQSGFYNPNGQQTHQQPQGASSFPQQQPQQQQPSNSYSAQDSFESDEDIGNPPESQTKQCPLDEECVESYLCHRGFIISRETASEEALEMDIDIRLNEKVNKCYEEYDGTFFVCCKRRPTEAPVLSTPFSQPMHSVIPIVTTPEISEFSVPTLPTFFESLVDPTSQNETESLIYQNVVPIQNPQYNRGVVQSLTQLNYVTLPSSSQGQTVSTSTAIPETEIPSTTTAAPLQTKKKPEKIRIQLTSNFGGSGGGGPSKNNFKSRTPLLTSQAGITGSGGNVVSSFKVSAPQNVKITDVSLELPERKTEARIITASPPRERQGSPQLETSRSRMLNKPMDAEQTTEGPSEVPTKKQYFEYKDPVLVLPPPPKTRSQSEKDTVNATSQSSETEESEENAYKTINNPQQSDESASYSMEYSHETSMEPQSQVHHDKPSSNPISTASQGTRHNQHQLPTSTSPPTMETSTRRTKVDIIFFGDLSENDTKGTTTTEETSTTTTTTTTTAEIPTTTTTTTTTSSPTTQNPETTTTEETTVFTSSTDRSKTHLYPFLPGPHRPSTYVTGETGERIKVPSQYYDPPNLSSKDLLKLIVPPSSPEDKAADLLSDEETSEARQIQFLSSISGPGPRQTVVDECPENMKCLSEAYCSNSNSNEGDTDAFDIRLQVRKRSTRQKCRQPNLPVDGYCCYLREDFAALNRTSNPGTVGRPGSSNYKKKNDESCGIRRPHEDGRQPPMDGSTAFGEFPWHSLILTSGQPHCSGVILNQRIVATTATCLNNTSLEEVSVRVGEWEVESDAEPKPHQDLLPKALIVHPGFKVLGGNFVNDIALIVTSENIKFDYHVSRICLPQPFDRLEEKRCVATGWAQAPSGTKLQLKQSSLPVISNPLCDFRLRKSLGMGFHVHRTSICAGGEPNGDSCVFHLGGPLVCEDADTGSYTLAGLSSWGNPCQTKEPGVYTSIPTQIDWIYTILRKDPNNLYQK